MVPNGDPTRGSCWNEDENDSSEAVDNLFICQTALNKVSIMLVSEVVPGGEAGMMVFV